MHWPAEDGTPLEAYWQAFTDLKREGKIRAAGLSNHGVLQLEAAEEIGPVDAIQPPFNLIHRDAADDVLLWARDHEAGAIVYSPMASGLLTGAFTAARAARLQPVTGGPGNPDFTEPALSANLALAEALRPVAERHGVTPAAVAVAWTLAFPGVTGAIVGARNPGQVDGWLPAANLELKDDDSGLRHRRRRPRHRGRDRLGDTPGRSPVEHCAGAAARRQRRLSQDMM